MFKMENLFENLKKNAENLHISELQKKVSSLVAEIINTDDSLLSVSKHFVSYGTYKTKGFANEYHFGNELASLIVRALSGKITHCEDAEFTPADFETELIDYIFEKI